MTEDQIRDVMAQARTALTALLTHPTIDLSDFMRGKLSESNAALESALRAMPAQAQNAEAQMPASASGGSRTPGLRTSDVSAPSAQTQALAPLSEGALMGVYMDFDRNAERTWLPAEYLLRFAAAVQQAVLKGVQP